jgi:hypothetical protein
MTIVDCASNSALDGLPTTSEETSGSFENSRKPLSGAFPAAVSKALFTSSIVTVFESVATRSITEPSGTGTRSDVPSSLPLSFGRIFPTARAAPVVVGMMFIAPARARRRSLCGRSRMFWSFV